ncbi:MAG: VCBS repeat-containing protein [Bacilli bacterium]|nr:VCBS repeat-containing protein [Bacilli bacterium]
MKEYFLIDKKVGDVTGKGMLYEIDLLGKYVDKKNTQMVESLKIEVRDQRKRLVQKIFIPDVIGYQPTLLLLPFRNKEIEDIFVSIESGGSGAFGYFYLYGYEGNQFEKIFDTSQFNKMFSYVVPYLKQYQVEVLNQTLKRKYMLDIKDRGPEYLNQIYQKNGQLIKPIFGDVSDLNQLFPLDINGDGIYELATLQRVIGLYNADLLGYLQTVLYWQKNHFDLFYGQQYFAQIGYEIQDNKG